MPLLKSLATFTAASAAFAGAGWKLYTKDSRFVPYGVGSPDFQTALWRARNPASNPPACIDHCERRVPLAKLQTTDQEELTRRFCAGVWSGPGFAVQRRQLEKAGRHLPGRQDHLWEKEEFEKSDYQVGTKIADHFEVVERTPGKVAVRCGDTPAKQDFRPSDGIFSLEVTKDDEYATFHMKSYFFNSTAEGSTPSKLPWWFPVVHREYAKLWMETSVRKLLK